MKKLGCTIATATNGLEAVECYKTPNEFFDVVFMGKTTPRPDQTKKPYYDSKLTIRQDISMPVMNGFEASKAIRDFERRSSAHQSRPARVIALTGLGSDAARQEAIISGIDEFRVKPVLLKELREILCLQ